MLHAHSWRNSEHSMRSPNWDTILPREVPNSKPNTSSTMVCLLVFYACSCQIEPVLQINITKSSFATGNGHRWFEMILLDSGVSLQHLVSPDFLNILLRTWHPYTPSKASVCFPPGSWENQEALTGHIFSRRKISSMRSKMVSRRDNLGERKRLGGKSGKMMHLIYIYIIY